MSALALTRQERSYWTMAGGAALALHLGAAALVLAWVRPAEPPVPEPVVLVELPPMAELPAAAAPQPAVQPQPDTAPPPLPMPPLDIPPVRAPLPRDPVVLPPPVTPARQAEAAPAAAPAMAAPAPAARPAASATPGDDPRARQQEVNYFALVSAHLNRRKVYPVEARQARQQGVVTVRFTVDRSGAVSAASIKRSSGHAVLDQATLDLLQRVAPLPRMPASMQRDSVTLALPIDYSLRTN